MTRLLALALIGLAFAGCGGGGAATGSDAKKDVGSPDVGPPNVGPPDAGPSDAGPPFVTPLVPRDAGPREGGPPYAPPPVGPPDGGMTAQTLPAGWNAFDVTATLTLKPVAGVGDWRDLPKTHTFTFVWNRDATRVMVGAGGAVSSSIVSSREGVSFSTRDPLSVEVAFADGCGGVATISYDSIAFSYDGVLHGTASGHASYQLGSEILSVELTATLVGVADTTPPVIKAPGGTVSPLELLVLPLSEPVPLTATASLVGMTSGEVVPLVLLPGPANLGGRAFVKPNVVLRYDETYRVVTSGLVDFAGLHAVEANAPTLRTGPPPPLVPEDGFESVTTPSFAGAGVLHGGPLTPLAGQTSLILNTGVGGGFGFLPYHLGPQMAVRLAVAPGAKLVFFTMQVVTTYELPEATFHGVIRVGAPGGPPLEVGPGAAKDFVKVTLPVDGDVYLSPPRTMGLGLPMGATEVTFEIAGVTSGCGLPPPPTALIIDDLRVE